MTAPDNTAGTDLDTTRRQAADMVPHIQGPPSARQLEAITRLATQISDTEFVPEALRGRAPAVLAAILTGSEIGVGPMQSLQKLYVTDDGSIGQAAELMRALILSAGHHLKVTESSTTKVTIEGWRSDETREDAVAVTWTVDDALRAGLIDSIDDDGMPVARSQYGNPLAWEKYPRMMLLARATAELARMVFPDVLSGISYTPDEIDAADVVDVTPEGHFVYGDADAADVEDRDVPPDGVDATEFRKDLFRRYRTALDVIASAVPAKADQMAAERTDALEGRTVATLDSDDWRDWGRAWADAPLGVLRDLTDDADAVRDDLEADGRCGFRFDDAGGRCVGDARHDGDHTPPDGEDDGDGDTEPPPDETEHDDPTDEDGEDGPDEVPVCYRCEYVAADCVCDEGPMTEPFPNKWDDTRIADADPQDLVDAGVADDRADAAHAIQAAQDRLNGGGAHTDRPSSVAAASGPVSEGLDSGDVGSGPQNGSGGVGAGGAFTVPDRVREVFVEAMDAGAADLVSAATVDQVIDNVERGQWAASMILTVELTGDSRKTLVPKLEELCEPRHVRWAHDLAEWWAADGRLALDDDQ